MRLPRWTPVAAAAVLALTAGGVAAAAGHDHVETAADTSETVVNPAGHEVDEHAAFGQLTAAEAHAQGEAADDDPGEEAEHGRSDEEHGKVRDEKEHGKARDEHGKAGEAHGHAGEHGQGHAWAFGHLSPEARRQAIADMQAEH